MNQTSYEFAWNDSLKKNGIDVITYNEHTEFPTVKAVLVSFSLGCIIFLTIGGNITVLLAVYIELHLRNATNYFIANLAIADLFLGVIVLPLSATLEVLRYWPFGEILCDVWAAVDVLLCTASILTLCVISVDRYIGVTSPLQHASIITKRRAVLIVMLVWVLSSLISVAPIIGWSERTGNQGYDCTVTKQIGYVMFSVAGSFYIPMFIIIVVYTKIYREVCRHNKFLKNGTKTIKNGEHNGIMLRIHTARKSQVTVAGFHSIGKILKGSTKQRSSKIFPASVIAKFTLEKKAAKTLGIVVGVFLICWFPFFFYLPLDVLCTSCHFPDELFTVIFWLGYCNSLMNPFIYASSSREFKQAFIKVLQCQRARKHERIIHDHSLLLKITTKSKMKEMHTDVPLYVLNDNVCKGRKNSDSPIQGLVAYQEKRKLSSTNRKSDI